jgi:hypothetical protein
MLLRYRAAAHSLLRTEPPLPFSPAGHKQAHTAQQHDAQQLSARKTEISSVCFLFMWLRYNSRSKQAWCCHQQLQPDLSLYDCRNCQPSAALVNPSWLALGLLLPLSLADHSPPVCGPLMIGSLASPEPFRP